MKELYMMLLGMLLLSGCYRDKGNYDYTPLNEITIAGIDEKETYYCYLGKAFTMPEPQIIFADSTLAHDDLSYEWRLDNRVVSHEKILDVEVAFEPQGLNYWGDFRVKDERTGVSYIQKFKFTVMSNFTSGWMWLSEKEGKAEMNMLTSTGDYYGNIIASINETELGAHGYQLVEHFSQVGSSWYTGVLAVAGENSIELDWSSLRKEAWMYEEFSGAAFPDGFQPVASAFTKNYSCAIGDNGKVHVRYSEGGYLYEGRYPSMPFYTRFSIAPKVASAYPPAYNTIIFFDEAGGGYVYLDADGALQSLSDVRDERGAFPVTGMNKDLLYISAVAQNGDNTTFYAVLQDKASKKCVAQQFEFGITGRQAYLKTLDEHEFPDQVNGNTRFAISYKKPYVWYSNGNTLYRYDRNLNGAPEPFKEFSGNILALAVSPDQYSDQYAVIYGDENNSEFYANTGYSELTQGGLSGKVTDLIYKVGMYYGQY